MSILKRKPTETKQPDSLFTDEQRQAMEDRAVELYHASSTDSLRREAEFHKARVAKEIGGALGRSPELDDSLIELGKTVSDRLDKGVEDYAAGKHYGSSDETHQAVEQTTKE